MYGCPNCAGNLKFDIASQQLCCEHCGTLVDPYGVHKETDAEETVMSAEEAEAAAAEAAEVAAAEGAIDSSIAIFN